EMDLDSLDVLAQQRSHCQRSGLGQDLLELLKGSGRGSDLAFDVDVFFLAGQAGEAKGNLIPFGVRLLGRGLDLRQQEGRGSQESLAQRLAERPHRTRRDAGRARPTGQRLRGRGVPTKRAIPTGGDRLVSPAVNEGRPVLVRLRRGRLILKIDESLVF